MEPELAIAPHRDDEPVAHTETNARVAREWRVHPAIPQLLDGLGLADALTPDDDNQVVRRVRRREGGYWRVEYTGRAEGALDHFVEIRNDDAVAIPRIMTNDGTLEIDIQQPLPETVVAGMTGRTLGEIIDVMGQAGEIPVMRIERRVLAQRQPLRLHFEKRDYMQIDQPMPD